VQGQFRESQLKADIDNHSDLNTFRDIRRKITKMYVHGSKMLKNIEKISTGDHECLFQVETNIKPTFIGKENISKIVSDFDDTVKTINAKLFNVSVENCKDEICEVLRLISCTDPLLIAKAWRTSQKTPMLIKNIELNNLTERTTDRMTGDQITPTERMTDQIIQLETMTDEGHPIIKLTENDYTVTDEKTSMTDKIRTDIEETTETIIELIIMITPEITKDGHTGMTRLNFPACHVNGTVTIITMMPFFLEDDDYYLNRRKHY